MREYSYNIINDVYNWMISRKKDIEVRILKEKSEKIQIGDFITFNNQENDGQFVKVKVIDKKLFDEIEELFDQYEVNRMMPNHTEDELKALLYKIYGDELNVKPIVAFEFQYLYSDKECISK